METSVPQDLTALPDEELASTLEALIAEFDRLHDEGSTDIVLMTEIAEAVETVQGEIATREEAAALAAEQVALLAERIRAATTAAPAEEETPATEEEPVAAAEPITEEPVAVAAAQEESVAVTTAPPVAVTAAAPTAPRRPSARGVRSYAPPPAVPAASPELTIIAAADVPGVATGQRIDKMTVVRAMHDKARALRDRLPRVPIARFEIPYAEDRKVGAEVAHNLDVIERVRHQGNLVAAGGWCAPSNNIYSLFGVDAADGLIDLPTIQVTRGGVNVPDFLGINDASGALWTWTEADDIAAHDPENPEGSKPCLRIPCPSFTDYRLVAEGLCVTNGNLTDRSFPELTVRFLDLTMNAHLHRMSGAIISDISGSATGVTIGAYPTSAVGSILNAIDLQVEDYRSQYRMGVGTILEAIFPLWTRALLRADFAMREGADITNVTDAQVDAHFATRKIRPQFVHDYQPLFGVGPRTTWPTAMDFLLYPAGGYVRGDGGVIDLGIVRDSVLNATNDYTAAWTEQLYLVAQLGPAAREVTVNFAVDGVTGCCEIPPAE
jgi:hypothetical protein